MNQRPPVVGGRFPYMPGMPGIVAMWPAAGSRRRAVIDWPLPSERRRESYPGYSENPATKGCLRPRRLTLDASRNGEQPAAHKGNRSRGSDRSLVGFGNSLSRRDFVIIAQRFNAGKPGLMTAYSPVGTAEDMPTFSRPYGTFVVGRVPKSGVETPGYYQMSLRDIARPGDGGTEMWVIARLQPARIRPHRRKERPFSVFV